MNFHALVSRFVLLLSFGAAFSSGIAADPLPTRHFYDEVGFRHLTLKPVSGNHVEVTVRWASDPGSMSLWAGQGDRREGQVLFAATVAEEGEDRGAFFIAKGGESKVEISFRPGQKMPQDPGILGVYRHVSDEKFAQLMKKEFQAADDRLAATLKNASRTWPGSDKAVAGDWKARWPVLRERWMKIAYQAPEAAKPKPGQMLPAAGKDGVSVEKDPGYWLKLAQATALGYSFLQQPPDMKSDGGWDGEYDDGFGGHVSLRRSKDGKLRVTLSCTRGGELQGTDVSGTIPTEAVKEKDGEATAESVFTDPEGTKQTSVSLRRKGGFLWVETQSKQAANAAAWLDGIYRWSPVPAE